MSLRPKVTRARGAEHSLRKKDRGPSGTPAPTMCGNGAAAEQTRAGQNLRAANFPCDNLRPDLHAKSGEVTAMDYWELFCDTGAPEAYLLWRGQQEAACKTEKQ